MARCKIAVIRTGLGVSDSGFARIRQTVQDEVQREGLETIFLGTNQMRKNLDELVERIRTKVEQHITSTDRNRVGEALLRLIHVEKSNIAQRVAVTRKRRSTMKQKPSMAQEKAPEVDQRDAPTKAQKKGPEVNQHDAPKMKQKLTMAQQKDPQFDKYDAKPNPQQEGSSTNDGPKTPTIPQTHHTSPQNNDELVRDSAIIIRLEADLSKKFITNLGFILTGSPDPNDKGDDLLYKVSYEKLSQSLRADTFLTADSGDKLWGFVPGGGLASGWWRIRADPSLRACLHAQQACSDIGRFLYIINQGSSYFCVLLMNKSFLPVKL